MRTLLLSGLILCMSFSLTAQKKQLSTQQMWDNSVRLTDYTYRVSQWTDDKVIFIGGSPSGHNRIVTSVNLKTGKKETLTEMPRPAISFTGPNTKVDGINPTYSPDSAYIAYTRNNDLYTLRLSDMKETRLTTDGSDLILNGYASWVYMEEILGRSSNYRAFWWSPDSRHIAFFRADDTQLPLFTITDSQEQNGYVETLRYPKPGNPIPVVKTGIVSPDGGAIVWAKTDHNEPFYFAQPYWRPDGKALWLQWSNRKQNHLKILEADLSTGALRQIYEERQDSWIAIDQEPRIRFLESGKGFILASDKTGWMQLYLHDMDGKLVNPITNGNYTVLNVLRVDEKEKTVFFTCYKDNIGCEDFYKASLDGKKLQRLSFGNYSHRISMSNNGKYFVSTYSNVDTPPRVALYTTQGKLICQVQDTKTENVDAYERPRVEFVTLKSDDGKFDLPMRIIWPIHMEAGKKYPVSLNIYGGPGSLRVRADWVDAFGGLSHQYAKDGLIQVMIDHRGSGHNGKAGQNYMYRNLGYWEIKDFTQCVQWLVQNKQADPQKIYISGFSYGGYLTSYALTYGADTFTHGIAGGSVTDWMLYDATYTERFMDIPQDNPEGYEKSSVHPYADRLKGKLLLTHGLRDENVHIQNTWQLVSLFEDAGKEFDLMVYPESRHGYRGNKQIHSMNMTLEFIYKHLLEKPVPPEAYYKLSPRR